MGIDLNKIIENVSKTQFKGGLFSKTCFVLVSYCICIAAITISSNSWLSYISVGIISLIILVVLCLLISFANRNPQVAIMEGAEFLNNVS